MTPTQILDKHFKYSPPDHQWVIDQLVMAGDMEVIQALDAALAVQEHERQPRLMGLQSGDVLNRWHDEPTVTYEPKPVSPVLRMVALGSFAALCILGGYLLLGALLP